MQRKRIALGLTAGVINEAANKLIPLATLHFAATRLGVKPFGLSQFSQWLTDFGMILVAFGFSGWAPIAWRGSANSVRSVVFASVILTRVCLAALACGLLFFAVQDSGTWSEYRWIVLPSLFIVIVSAFDCMWAVISLQALPLFSGISILAKLGSLAAIFLLVQGPQDALTYTLSLHGANAVIAMASFFYVLRQVGWTWPNHRQIVNSVRQAFPFAISAILLIALERVDLALVEYSLGAEGAGAYGGPMKIAMSLTPIAGMIATVFFSEILNIFDDESTLRHLRVGLRVAMLILSPLVVGVWFVDQELVTLILGAEFARYATVMPILCTGIMAQMFILVFGNQVLTIRGRINLYNWALIAGLITILSVNYYLGTLSDFGIAGFAIASVAGRWIAAGMAVFFSFLIMRGGRRRVIFEVAKGTVPAATMGIALAFLPDIPWYLTILAGAALYTIVAGVMFRSTLISIFNRGKNLANQ